jgi:2-iminobutanoate/2-iminopropanoate deaminase
MKKIISTDKAPAAIGPYNQAIDTGTLIFVAGQIPVDPAEGKIVEQDIAGQTRQALKNVKAILTEAGLGMENVVKATVFLASMDDFQAMNKVYAEYFANEPPARAAFEVAALPLGARVEIEAIASR